MRVLKALEVSIQTGKPYSGFLSATKKERPFRILRVALDMERELLYKGINMRVDQMMDAGLLEEVKQPGAFAECDSHENSGIPGTFQVPGWRDIP